MALLSALQSGATVVGNLMLVTPSKRDLIGIRPQPAGATPGETPPSIKDRLLFHYEGEQSIALSSDITDHFVEDNTAIQDHIARKPITITTHGFIGELNDVVPDILQDVKLVADKLLLVSEYTPQLTLAAQLAYNKALQLYQTAQNLAGGAASIGQDNGTTEALASFANLNKQQIYFKKFYEYWNANTLFTVQTPWAVFNDMAIQSLRAIQEQDTQVVTDFEITFKQMRFAKTITVPPPVSKQGRLEAQASNVIDHGKGSVGPSQPVLGALI